jgi:tryptophan synthase alpha chain
MTAAASRGFVYATAVMGVTGARTTVSDAAEVLVDRVRAADKAIPVCVGLGVSNHEQAAQIGAYADGVIVGSAFVRRLLDEPNEKGVEAVRQLASELSA